jgi:hypothetical protein
MNRRQLFRSDVRPSRGVSGMTSVGGGTIPDARLLWLAVAGWWAVVCLTAFVGHATAASAGAQPPASAPPAQQSPVEDLVQDQRFQELELGIGGMYKLGRWTPLRISLSPSDRALRQAIVEVELIDSAGVPARYQSIPFDVEAGESTTQELLVKFGSQRGEIVVRLRVPGALVAEQTVLAERRWPLDALPAPVRSSQRTVLSVGDNLDLANLLAQPGGFQEPLAYANVASLEELPQHWLGLRGVDVLVLTTATADLPPASAPAWLALRTWVEQGGVIVWSVAEKASELVQSEQPLAWLLPGPLRGGDRTAANERD